MKKRIGMLFLVIAAALSTGCKTYSDQKWTPDSFNYTMQRDRSTGDMSDYWGFSWNLKP